ncbi:MAG: hypothetical protein ACXVLT_13885 [Flavisolibacter sp.]
MRKIIVVMTFLMAANAVSAQKVDSIYFHLYTDSLKKGFYNYINVDGKLSDGTWAPLDSTQVLLISDGGYFKGNDLFIDSSYDAETVRVKAVLKTNPSIHKEVVIYIRKRGFTEPLKTNEEILDEMRHGSKTKVKKG